MIVELVGPTGAGKSTLARRLAVHLGAGAVLAPDLVMDRPLLRKVDNAQVANLVQDVRAWPYLSRSLPEHADVLRLAARILVRHAPTSFDLVMNARSIMRRVGMYELARSKADGRTVLLDEGPVLIACHLFVYSSSGPAGADLARFADTVPLPDRVIYVRCPLPVLAQRAFTRPDRRRQLSGMSPEEVQAPLQRARDVFDRLVAMPRLRGRTVVVDNPSRDPAELDRCAAELARSLRPSAGPAQQETSTLRTAPR